VTVVYALPFEPVVPLVRSRSILGPGPDLAGGGPGARATCTPPLKSGPESHRVNYALQ